MSENLFYYSILTGISGYLVHQCWLNRWNILDYTLDRYFEFNRYWKGANPVMVEKSNSTYLLVTKIGFRAYHQDRLVEAKHYLVDLHLYSDTIDLSQLLLNKPCHYHYPVDKESELDEKSVNQEEYHLLVDISYHYRGEKYKYTTELEEGEYLVKFYSSEQIKGKCHVYFSDVIIKKIDGSVERIDNNKVNQYLGPLGDFHSSLRPMRVEWLFFKEHQMKPGEQLILLTELMEESEFNYGDMMK